MRKAKINLSYLALALLYWSFTHSWTIFILEGHSLSKPIQTVYCVPFNGVSKRRACRGGVFNCLA